MYHTFFQFYRIAEKIIMYKGNYQQLYQIFVELYIEPGTDSNVPPFSGTALSHIC